MPTILLHSSKTMRSTPVTPTAAPQVTMFLAEARYLHSELERLSLEEVQRYMQLSATKAAQTRQLIANWTGQAERGRPAIDAFLGDIYSGLQVQTFTAADRDYANHHLLILSGLYGALRALDSIEPYRLEMGYKFPLADYSDLYDFWGDKIARSLPSSDIIINLSAVEYTKALLPSLPSAQVITPKFLTVSPKTDQPVFVTVHAKIARGAFAHWLITQQITDPQELIGFTDLGYRYDPSSSTPDQPVFVCQRFEGLGLSVRLT